MIFFQTLFSFNGEIHTTSVQRISGNPVHYLVRSENQSAFKITDPFINTANVKDDMINYPILMEYPELGIALALSVKTFCHDNKIPFLV